MNNEELLAWFQVIAEENNINISEMESKTDIRGVINYFRTLWKGRPTVLNSNRGSKPIIDECSEAER